MTNVQAVSLLDLLASVVAVISLICFDDTIKQ